MEDIHTPNIKPEELKPETKVIVKKSLLWPAVTGLLLILLVASVWTGGFGFNGLTGAAPTQQNETNPTENTKVDVSTGDGIVLGNADAPVTIIEFSDFQCPYCARFVTQTMPELKSKYIDTGKVNLVFREFPLSFHQNSNNAANAAECAGDKFFEMHDKLFAGQADWSSVADPTTVFKGYAKATGVNTTQWDSCYSSKQYADEISKDFSDGAAAGVTGTPTFFIGNDKDGYTMLVGAQPASAFEQIIDAELK